MPTATYKFPTHDERLEEIQKREAAEREIRLAMQLATQRMQQELEQAYVQLDPIVRSILDEFAESYGCKGTPVIRITRLDTHYPNSDLPGWEYLNSPTDEIPEMLRSIKILFHSQASLRIYVGRTSNYQVSKLDSASLADAISKTTGLRIEVMRQNADDTTYISEKVYDVPLPGGGMITLL